MIRLSGCTLAGIKNRETYHKDNSQMIPKNTVRTRCHHLIIIVLILCIEVFILVGPEIEHRNLGLKVTTPKLHMGRRKPAQHGKLQEKINRKAARRLREIEIRNMKPTRIEIMTRHPRKMVHCSYEPLTEATATYVRGLKSTSKKLKRTSKCGKLLYWKRGGELSPSDLSRFGGNAAKELWAAPLDDKRLNIYNYTDVYGDIIEIQNMNLRLNGKERYEVMSALLDFVVSKGPEFKRLQIRGMKLIYFNDLQNYALQRGYVLKASRDVSEKRVFALYSNEDVEQFDRETTPIPEASLHLIQIQSNVHNDNTTAASSSWEQLLPEQLLPPIGRLAKTIDVELSRVNNEGVRSQLPLGDGMLSFRNNHIEKKWMKKQKRKFGQTFGGLEKYNVGRVRHDSVSHLRESQLDE
mmetsp:Transcript_31849/g.51599  ORF Transcript_31849/g.51599 Transcript_31849/m.51599 type:complete len:409 (+) Transcript_31849:165-1391(+)